MKHKAPGKAFRKGMSLIEIMQMFPSDATAEKWFTEVRWPIGPACPHCGSIKLLTGAAHKTMPYRCREKECRKRFSVRTGTVMEASNLGYQTWAVAIYLCLTSLKGVSSMKLHRDLNITQKSAWHLAHRIRKALESGSWGLFTGPVEVDETYMGGKRANMSNAKRAELAGTGRGAVGKTTIVGAKDRAKNLVSAKVVQDTKKPTLHGFVSDNTAPGVTVYTDDALVYETLPFQHEVVRHSVREYVKGLAHTNGVESFWSMLKRAYAGTYHKMSPKHLERYLNEFITRHNIRPMDTIDQMRALVLGMDCKRLKYADLIKDNGLDSGARE